MINIHNQIFTQLTTLLVAHNGAIKTSSVYTNMPSSFPFVSIEELDNTTYENGLDDTNAENFAVVDYEINIYTKDPLKKSSNDGIVGVVDTYFNSIGFTRRSKNTIQDNNETIYRRIIRYTAVVGNDDKTYRR